MQDVFAYTPDIKQIKRAAASESWLKLLHYDNSGKSAIKTRSFFLSADGMFDAEKELLATITALQSPVRDSKNHPQCRFPGRRLWLEQQFALQLQHIDCAEFNEFTNSHQLQSISLVFATGFLGNPASYYGHLLLKLNTDGAGNSITDLEAKAVNFGANVPQNENMLLYIGKGMSGGYGSSFSHLQYFYHSHNYGESELRDMWEFELNLTAAELRLIAGHLWEVMAADFTYYFFDRNCAYRIGEVLQLVVDTPLIHEQRMWETPQAVVQRVKSSRHHGGPLVKDVRFYPSRLSRLYQRYAQLSSAEQREVHLLAEAPEKLNINYISSLPVSYQHAVLDTLLDYYQVLRDEKAGDTDPHNENYRQVLSLRYMLAPGSSSARFDSANRPDQGRSPSYFNAGVIHRQQSGSSLNLWLRPAYYDPLDASYGHIRHSGLSMGEIQLGVNGDRVFVRDLNIVRIDSVRSNYTGLPGDRNYSWYFELGARPQANCIDCFALKLRSGIGYATTMANEGFTLAAFVGAGFHDEKLLSRGTYLAATTQANWYLNDRISLHANAEQRWYQDHRASQIYRMQARWAWTEQFDSRLEYVNDEVQEFGISFGWYW